jgi:hypothetical protein
MIASALMANDIHIFGHHPKDNSPSGHVLRQRPVLPVHGHSGRAARQSMHEPLRPEMAVTSLEGLPELPQDDRVPALKEPPLREVEVLILGGGPAGLSAAIELGKLGVDTLIVDDKSRLGGKLLLQTHKFFGSVEDSHAGTRGFEIARILEEEVRKLDSVEVWLNTTAVGVFSDRIVGVVKGKPLQKDQPQSFWWPQVQGRRCFHFRETPCRASMGQELFRRWSIAILSGHRTGFSSWGAVMWGSSQGITRSRPGFTWSPWLKLCPRWEDTKSMRTNSRGWVCPFTQATRWCRPQGMKEWKK